MLEPRALSFARLTSARPRIPWAVASTAVLSAEPGRVVGQGAPLRRRRRAADLEADQELRRQCGGLGLQPGGRERLACQAGGVGVGRGPARRVESAVALLDAGQPLQPAEGGGALAGRQQRLDVHGGGVRVADARLLAEVERVTAVLAFAGDQEADRLGGRAAVPAERDDGQRLAEGVAVVAVRGMIGVPAGLGEQLGQPRDQVDLAELGRVEAADLGGERELGRRACVGLGAGADVVSRSPQAAPARRWPGPP